jgi:hypothetical protein
MSPPYARSVPRPLRICLHPAGPWSLSAERRWRGGRQLTPRQQCRSPEFSRTAGVGKEGQKPGSGRGRLLSVRQVSPTIRSALRPAGHWWCRRCRRDARATFHDELGDVRAGHRRTPLPEPPTIGCSTETHSRAVHRSLGLGHHGPSRHIHDASAKAACEILHKPLPRKRAHAALRAVVEGRSGRFRLTVCGLRRQARA